MKLIIIPILMVISIFSEASIYIKGSQETHENFLALVQEKKGITIKEWLHKDDMVKSNLNALITSGERLLSHSISVQEFYDLTNKERENSVITSEWRQAFVDILLKWLEQNKNNDLAIIEDVCYFYHLDSEVSQQNPELNSKCRNNKQLFFLNKPQEFRNELITVDGVLWNDTINFYKRKQTRLSSQIKIYSDEFLPHTEYRHDLSLGRFERLRLTTGNCHNVKNNLHQLSGYNIPVHQILIVNENSCIDLIVLPSVETSPRFWQKNKTWLILGGILLSGFVISQVKDKEIVFEY